MKLYVEVFFIFVLIIIFLIWKVWEKTSRKKLLKQYNPEKDVGKVFKKGILNNYDDTNYKGGVFNEGTTAEGKPRNGTESSSLIGHEQSEGRGLLQKTDVSDAGKNSSSARKNLSDVKRRLFGNRKKRK
jgi:hypothetical protein